DTMRIQVEPESETLTSLEEAPSAQLLRMILGCALNQAIYTFATLGVADLLASAPRGSEELAEATHTDGALLHRVLRALSSANILDEQEDGRFALTSVGECLRTDVPGSLRAYATLHGSTSVQQLWQGFLHNVQTGETAFEH